jgi:small ligand-binding sensory domain FIST
VSATGAGDLPAAARLAVTAALDGFDGPPDLVAVFASSAAGSAEADELARVGPLVQELTGAGHLIGCTAAGVCGAGDAVLGAPAVSVWAAVLPDVSTRVFHLEVLRTGEGLAVVGLPEPRESESVVLLFADPYSFPVVSFVDRAAQALPDLDVVGGLAGGPAGAGSTRLYQDDRAYDRGAVGLVLGGRVGAAGTPVARIAVSQGCRPVGPEMVVTRAEGNLLLELAGRPALEQLHELVEEIDDAERESFGSAPQIGVAMNEYADEHRVGDFLIRPVIGIDETKGAVAVGDVVEVGRTVRFQVRDAEAARFDLREHLLAAGPSDGALLISCNGRGPGMFGRADVDVQLTEQCLGGAAVAGLFAGGELGPVGGRTWLHGFTASVLIF